MAKADSQGKVEKEDLVAEAITRGIIQISSGRVTYNLNKKKDYDWNDPEEWVRARTIAFLVIAKGYPANRILTEVKVPRRTPSDFADIVVYQDDKLIQPYLVVETKAIGRSKPEMAQAIEQAFGNANSLRSKYTLYDEHSKSSLYDVEGYPPMERQKNFLGIKETLPEQYGNAPKYLFTAGTAQDIQAVRSSVLENKLRRAHSIIWAGGRRDPLTAFDEWSKLLFAKVIDERSTPSAEPRKFQVGTKETSAIVATRIHRLFEDGAREDPTIFPAGTRIELPDSKIHDVVQTIQDISFTRTDVDSIGVAFENFFGSVFRGELGQYFTMRPLARFTVAMMDFSHKDFVIDPTAGSGGFLLETLLQVWHRVEEDYKGQPKAEIDRIKVDFALHRVYGIEIHEILARICKINLLLHHDGHTNIEGDRSCLDATFSLPRLNPPKDIFTRVVGNPPFGDEVEEGDQDHLGSNHLSSFQVATDRSKVASEHAIIERSIDLLLPGGKLGFVVPDGLLNNQGELSNCPRMRNFLAKNGHIEAIISLPDYAFRKSGAQNKTSILVYRKFNSPEESRFRIAFEAAIGKNANEEDAIAEAYEDDNYPVFLAESNRVGYTPSGVHTHLNDLYRAGQNGPLASNQDGTILGEYRSFTLNQSVYKGSSSPDCMRINFLDLWRSHESHRLDPKYFLFKRQESSYTPQDWIRKSIGNVMRRREETVRPEEAPDQTVVVLTISQTGELRRREAGKGVNPPEWLGMYFDDSSSTWYKAHAGDVVFSSIDLWKGCVSVVPPELADSIVTKEFPIYEITDERLDPTFVSYLLRSRYYQRAFRAITTGHSNRRRTQAHDFEALEICFPPTKDLQRELIARMKRARVERTEAEKRLKQESLLFNIVIDGRGIEELPDIPAVDENGSDDNSN